MKEKIQMGMGILIAITFLLFAIGLAVPGPQGYADPSYISRMIKFLAILSILVAAYTLFNQKQKEKD